MCASIAGFMPAIRSRPITIRMIAKLIVYGRTREGCIMRLRRALEEMVVEGVKTYDPAAPGAAAAARRAERRLFDQMAGEWLAQRSNTEGPTAKADGGKVGKLPSITDIGILLAGLVVLIIGGDVMVRGAIGIAERLRLSPMLIGLVIVGLGTSTPELAASVQAALAGSPGIALGNIVGSNLANLLLVLGAAALIAPMAVDRTALWRDGGVGLFAALALVAASFTLGLDRITATMFLIGLVA